MRTDVAIVGGGPAGTLLGLLLRAAGVETIVLERHTRQHVLDRVRAGVLEWWTVQVLREAGLAERLDREGAIHAGAAVAWGGRHMFFDIAARTGKHFVAYGQSPLQADLYAAADERDLTILTEADDVVPHDVAAGRPFVTFRHDGEAQRIECDFVVGCDGSHGVCRTVVPAERIRTFEKEYPFGWLGVLCETPPLPDLVYCSHERGFALASQRNPQLSRYYVQCPLDETIGDWPDERFWFELLARFPPDLAERIVTGPSIEKSIAPVRSFVAEPLRHGSLFLAGDAAHIVPPTGAKGLNLAVSDVHYLAEGLIDHYRAGDDRALDHYSDRALHRVWNAVRFSWWMTMLLHRVPGQTPFDLRAREVELDYIAASEAAQTSLCEQYAGLPL
jgi:p-hydroxybenzoate 3-monooxygenase